MVMNFYLRRKRQKMIRDENKKNFIKLLEEASKLKQSEKKLKALIEELKKRRFGFFHIKSQNKLIILAQKEGGKRGAKFTDPHGKGWADSFRIDRIDVMLLWEEDLENKDKLFQMMNAFAKYDRYEMPYIL